MKDVDALASPLGGYSEALAGEDGRRAFRHHLPGRRSGELNIADGIVFTRELTPTT